MKVVFLHIPKTAGQSIHTALVNAYGEDVICPARVNEHLYKMGINELNRYQVFSGHLDWSLLDCVKGPKYVFTVLREPEDRILSFYFYLREEALKLSQDGLIANKPGKQAILEMTPNEYFCGKNKFRNFLDDHYDNFYTYYFANRGFQGRSRLIGLIRKGALSYDGLKDLAKENMSTLSDVFTIDEMDKVFDKIREISGQQIMDNNSYRVNVNTAVAKKQRGEIIESLGADFQVFEKIKSFCEFDNLLWKYYSN